MNGWYERGDDTQRCLRDFCGHGALEHVRRARTPEGNGCIGCPCMAYVGDAQSRIEPPKETTDTKATGTTGTHGTDALDAARLKFFTEARGAGGDCPVCDRFGRMYVRRLNATMAHALVRLYVVSRKEPEREWFRYSEFTDTRNEYEKLKFWDLVEHKGVEDEEDAASSGMWKITNVGRSWVELQMLLPEKVVVYDGKVHERFGCNVSVNEVLGTRFSYSRLMGDFVNLEVFDGA